MKKFYASIILLISVICTEGQYSRHIVELRDKKGTPHTVSNPSTYLSAKAIARRSRYNIAIDSTDLPVSPAYIDSFRNVPNVIVVNSSRWLNQVLIRTTDPAALVKINSFPFVKSSAPVASVAKPVDEIINKFPDTFKPFPSRELTSERNRQNDISEIQDNTLSYGSNYNQIKIHQGEQLHNLGFTGRNMTIAFLDAGYFGYKTNPAFDSVRLQNRILGEYDFVLNETSVNEDHAHGMHCFSTVAANRPGTMVGTAPHASFWLFRTEDVGSEYPVEEQYWTVAAEFADSAGTDMISSSLGYTDFNDPSFNHVYAQRDGNTSIITRAADLAAKKGILVMNSAGNSGNLSTDFKYVSCPADGDSVVAVGAVDVNGNIAAFSSWGPNGAGKLKPDLVSVGQGTVIINTSGNPGTGNGTSYSNPNLAGLVACLWQAFPEFSNMEIYDAVKRSSNRYLNPDQRYGYGIPNFKTAFGILASKRFIGNTVNDGCATTITWSGKDNKSMKYEIERKLASDTGFIKIATISSQSDSFKLNEYLYRDELRDGGIGDQATYRLKQFIADTSFILYISTFPLTEICTVGDRLIVRPNPFRDNINVVIGTTNQISKLSVNLTDMVGRTLYRYQGSKTPGNFTLNIPGHGFGTGMYILTVRDGNKIIFTRKLTKGL